MLGFIKTSPKVETLSLDASEAIVFAVVVAILALGFGLRWWIYLSHGLVNSRLSGLTPFLRRHA
jgi:hypothetical protein